MTKITNLHLLDSAASGGAGETPAARADRAEYAGLVRAASTGDRPALERLLMRAQEVAYRFSMMACGNAEDAEDTMQDALVRTYRHVSRIRDPEAFRPWLYRTVRNACLMRRRRRVHEPSHLLSLDDVRPGPDGATRLDVADRGADPERLARNHQLRKRLRAAVAALPATHRVVVFLREFEGLSTQEVAHVLDISEMNVKTRLHRARLFLQQRLGDQR